MDNNVNHFFEILKTFDSAILITHSQEFGLSGRPMAIVEVDLENMLWLITAKQSGKVKELEHDSKIFLTFQNDHSQFLTLSGSARLIDDRNKIEALWKESYKIWFPQGVEDPSILLIQIAPSHGEYWDNKGFNKISYAFEAAKAYLTGSVPNVDTDRLRGSIVLK